MINALKNKARPYYRSVRHKLNLTGWQLQGKTNRGYCPICEKRTIFIMHTPWLRDNYKCMYCNSIPRERAIIDTLDTFVPDWKNKLVHESSPGGVSSDYIRRKCSSYSSSQYYAHIPRGEYLHGHRSEDLSNLTFEAESFDLIISQDVFEHVMQPAKAFQEIARVLKPGGVHLFTMPWYPKLTHTIQRAREVDGKIEFLEEPIYHGNPIDGKGSLVTFDWGIDFTDFIYNHSGIFTTIYLQIDRNKGLDADFLEVFISRKTDE